MASLATYVGDMATAIRVLRRVPLRVMQTDADDGPFPLVLQRYHKDSSDSKSKDSVVPPDICYKLHLLGVLGQVITVHSVGRIYNLQSNTPKNVYIYIYIYIYMYV